MPIQHSDNTGQAPEPGKAVPEINGQDGSQESLAAIQAMVHTIVYDLTQPLTVLMAEIQFATLFGETPDEASWARMEAAVDYITERLKMYQQVEQLQLIVNEAGTPVLNIQSIATSRPVRMTKVV